MNLHKLDLIQKWDSVAKVGFDLIEQEERLDWFHTSSAIGGGRDGQASCGSNWKYGWLQSYLK